MKTKKTKVLYVIDDGENDPFPTASRELDGLDLENGEKVAVYELKEIKTFSYEKALK